MTAPRRRLKACVDNWPGCESGDYNPNCCRWPKSCSATVYDDDRVSDDDLEPALKAPAPRASDAAMTDIVEFIRARLDEDDLLIRESVDDLLDGGRVGIDWSTLSAPTRQYLHRWLPVRMVREVAAKRRVLAEHQPALRTVEWPHDQTGTGEAQVCPRCQNAEHSDWNPPAGQAGVLPEGFVTPYVLAPCCTLLDLASAWSDHPDYDQAWTVDG